MEETPAAIADTALRQFVDCLRRRDVDGVAALFTEDAVLFGSDADEVARGHREIRPFIEGVFAQPATFGWEWNEPLAGREGSVVWFVATATTRVLGDDGGERTFPYRLSGVLINHAGQWRFALFNGAEPAAGG